MRRPPAPDIVDLQTAAARRKAVPDRRHDQHPDDPEVASGVPPLSAADRWRFRATVAAIVLGAAGILGGWIWSSGESGRALRALPPGQRTELLHHAVAALRDICDPVATRSLRDFCQQQAELALEFKECDAACQTLARRHVAQPMR